MDDEYEKISRELQEQMSKLVKQNEELEAKTGTFLQTRRDAEVRKQNHERLDKLNQDRRTLEKLYKWANQGRMLKEMRDFSREKADKKSAAQQKEIEQSQKEGIRNPAGF